jgi:5-dehydro-2-deoxygluconokinase
LSTAKDSVAALEVITMGRVSVDLYPEQIGVALPEVQTFRKGLGGSATNVAVAAARLGRRAAVITKVGADPFGAYVRAALETFSVDTSYVGTDSRLRTPIVFCEVFPPDHFPLLFYREPQAPDMELEIADLDLDAISGVRLFWTTGTGLSQEPSRSTTLRALEARSSPQITVHDLDYRPGFWTSPREAGELARRGLGYATVAVGNTEEVEVATGRSRPEEASAALLDMGVEFAIVKRGGAGVLGRTAAGVVEVPPLAVEVLNGLGAGDAFGGALCHGLLSGWDPERALAVANAAGAIVSSRLLCADEMPTMEEIEDLLEGAAR